MWTVLAFLAQGAETKDVAFFAYFTSSCDHLYLLSKEKEEQKLWKQLEGPNPCNLTAGS